MFVKKTHPKSRCRKSMILDSEWNEECIGCTMMIVFFFFCVCHHVFIRKHYSIHNNSIGFRLNMLSSWCKIGHFLNFLTLQIAKNKRKKLRNANFDLFFLCTWNVYYIFKCLFLELCKFQTVLNFLCLQFGEFS